MSSGIIVYTLAEQAIDALAAHRPGAEWEILSALASAVLNGDEIDPKFQAVANSVLLKAILSGKLPPRAKGRPPAELDESWAIAIRYFDLRDAGASYSDAVTELSNVHHKDARHIMRLVARGRSAVRDTKELRDQERASLEVMRSLQTGDGPDPYITLLEAILAEGRAVDLSAVAVERLEAALRNATGTTDTK